jgi:hypothetical protein
MPYDSCFVIGEVKEGAQIEMCSERDHGAKPFRATVLRFEKKFGVLLVEQNGLARDERWNQ